MASLLGDLRVSIGAEITSFASAMDRVERRIGTVEKKSEGLSKVGSRLRSVGTAITAGVGVPLAGVGALAVRTFADFERAMNRVRALTQATGEEFDQLKSLAIEQGRATVFSATDSARAMGFLAQAGLDTQQVLQALPGALQLAAAGGLDLAAAADIATNVLAGMQLSVGELSSVNDKLALTSSKANTNVSEMGEALAKVGPIASNSGQSLDDVSAALGALANQGIKGAEAGTAIRRIIGELVGPSTAAKRALADLGITLLDANGQIRPLTDIIGEFERAQQRLGDQTQFTARLFEIFGDRGGPAMAALISTGEAAVRKLSGAIRESDGFAKSFAETANQGVPKALAEMKAAAETLGISMAEKLAPEITGLLGSLKGMVDSLAEVDRGTLKTVATIGGLTVAFGGAVTVAGLFAGALRNILVVAPLVTGSLASMAAMLGPGGLIAAGVLAISPLIAKLFVGMSDAADSAIGKMVAVGDAIEDATDKARGWTPEQFTMEAPKAEAEAFSAELEGVSKAYRDGAAAAREFFAAQQAGQQPALPESVQAQFDALPRVLDSGRQDNTSLLRTGRDVTAMLFGIEDAAEDAGGAMAESAEMGVRGFEALSQGAGSFNAAFLSTLADLERGSAGASALSTLNERLREWLDLQQQVGGLGNTSIALGIEALPSVPDGQQVAVPPGLVGVLPEDQIIAAEARFEAFLDSIGASTAEARAELQSMFDVLQTGTLDGTALDPAKLQLVRDELADRLGFDDLGAAIDPVQAKIQRIAETLRSGAIKSELLPGESLRASNAELDRMRETLEELELSAEFGLQLDDTELQLRRMQETLATGLLPLSGEQASLRALEAVRQKIAEITLDDFRQEIAQAGTDSEKLDAIWARIQARMENTAPSAIPQAFEQFEESRGDQGSQTTEKVGQLSAALQGLMPVFGALQSATANLFSGIVTGAVTAKEAVQDFGRAMLGALAQIISRLTVAVALAAIVAAFGGDFGAVFGGLSGINVGARAIGGSVAQGEPYVVGERGPELFVPTRSGFIVPNHQIEQRAEGGPVAAGRPYVVGEAGPEVFEPVAAAGLSAGRGTQLGNRVASVFSAEPSLGAQDRGPSSIEQILRVDVALDDEGLIATLDGLKNLPEPPDPDDLAALIEIGLTRTIEKRLGEQFDAVREEIGGLGRNVEADVAKKTAKIPPTLEEIRTITDKSAEQIRGERIELGRTREQVERDNSEATTQTVRTNEDSQGVLDTVQVDLGDAVTAIQVASGIVLAAAALDLIPFLAEGGSLAAGQMAVVGERGPELFRPRVGGEVVSNKESRRLLRDSPAAPAAAGSLLPPAARAAGAAFSTVPVRSGQAEPGMRALAQGGTVEKDETVLVGEHGPELFLTRVPLHQGWYPTTYREWLGDERSAQSAQFLSGALSILLLPDLAKKETQPGGAFAQESTEDRRERIDSAIDHRNAFFKKLVEKRPPVHWTAPISGELLDLESAAFRFGTFGLPGASGATAMAAGVELPENVEEVLDAAEDSGGGVPKRALGGPVFPGKPVMVGERGAELFVPDAMGQIMSASRTGSLARSVAPSALGVDSGEGFGSGDTAREREGIRVEINFGSQQSVLAVRSWEEFARDVAREIDNVSRDYVIGGN